MKKLIFFLLVFSFAGTITFSQDTYLRKRSTSSAGKAARASTDSAVRNSILGWGIGMGIAIGTIVLLIKHHGGHSHAH